jgi:hypothetical protein
MTKTVKRGKSRKLKRARFSKKSFKKGGGFMSSFSMPGFSGNKVPEKTMDFKFDEDFKIYRKSGGQPVYMETATRLGDGSRQIIIDFSNATNTARCLGLGLAIRKGIIGFISKISVNNPTAIKYANDNIKLNKDNVCLSTNNKIVLVYNENGVKEFTLNGISLIAGNISSPRNINELIKDYHDTLVGKGKLFDANSNQKLGNESSAVMDQAEIIENNSNSN